VDHVLRKEVNMECVTPSHPEPIPSGESLTIQDVLDRTSGGSLYADGRPMETEKEEKEKSAPAAKPKPKPKKPNNVPILKHRSTNDWYLEAQACRTLPSVKSLYAKSRAEEGRGSSIWN
jgi:DNA polymerase gamma 1